MTLLRNALYLLASATLCLVACSKPPLKLAPDSGPEDAGEEDGGDAGCIPEGSECGPGFTCCGAPANVCDPSYLICAPPPDGGVDAGETDAGERDSGLTPLSDDGAEWLPETITGATIASLKAVTAPSTQLQLAAGAGTGVGQLVMRSPEDGGWLPVPNLPPSTALNGVWADTTGQVFAVGSSDGGSALFLAGTVTGGLTAVNLRGLTVPNSDAGVVFTSLDDVVGLGPGEALAVGVPASYLQNAAVHLLPDGGVVTEALPPNLELASVYKLAQGDGGPIYALATSNVAAIPPWVLEREAGVWSALPQLSAFHNGLPATITNLAVGPAGDVTVVGDDGDGHGVAFIATDGGFTQVLPRTMCQFGDTCDGGLFNPIITVLDVPPLTAVCEPNAGEYYLGASDEFSATAELLHASGGLVDGGMWLETLPATAQSINAIASDGTDVFAVGESDDVYPLAVVRSAP